MEEINECRFCGQELDSWEKEFCKNSVEDCEKSFKQDNTDKTDR